MESNDYSFLLHSIEDRISKETPQALFQEDSGSSRKRSRLTSSQVTPFAGPLSVVENTDKWQLEGALSRDALRTAAENDELRLLNEQLKDRIVSLQSESTREMEKCSRQLGFMEKENHQLKQLVEEANEKYYEEKKKAFARLREMQSEIFDLRKQLETCDVESRRSADRNSSVKAQQSAVSEDTWIHRLQSLEDAVKRTSADYQATLRRNGDLEATVSSLEQQLLLARTSANPDEDRVEIKELRRKCGELEMQLSKKSKELDRFVSKVHNQTMLEQEVESHKQLISNLENKMADHTTLETKYQVLLNEKQDWIELFKTSVLSTQPTDANGPISPGEVFRMLGSLQVQCAALTVERSRLASQLDQSTDAIRSLELEAASHKTLLAEKVKETEHLSSQHRIAMKRCQLFDGEIGSLRSLLASYDAEFKIGRPSVEKMLTMKNTQLEDLQQELDACRKSSSMFAEQLLRAQEELSQMKARPESKVQESLRADDEGNEYRVLHLIDNPAKSIVVATRGIQQDDSNCEMSSATTSSTSQVDSSKMNQRLKEMFKERITTFREAVYLLTGFKVDLISPDSTSGGCYRLKLRSMYAESPDDHLLFQWRGETLELLDTPFASRLDSKMFAYLTNYNSVPAFLCSITLDLFENQTLPG